MRISEALNKEDQLALAEAYRFYEILSGPEQEKIPEKFVNALISYGDLKSMLIKIRYSNDDQIAIVINRDDSEEDNLKFQQMQEWRSWCASLAKEIIKAMNE